MVYAQTFQGLLHSLVARKAGPFVVACGGTDYGQLQIGPRLLKPVGGTVHEAILTAAPLGYPRAAAGLRSAGRQPADVAQPAAVDPKVGGGAASGDALAGGGFRSVAGAVHAALFGPSHR